MWKRKATPALSSPVLKKPNKSQDYVFYNAVNKHNDKPLLQKVTPKKIGDRPIYKFFLDFDGKYFPIRCMLDLGSTSFVISPEVAKAFQIPVVKRIKQQKTWEVGGTSIKTEGLYTIPLGISCRNHRTYDDEDHAFEVVKTSSKYDALIQAWYLKKHRAEGTSTQLHFPHCYDSRFGHEKIRPDYEISYYR
jgi:hypothetical protein